MREHFEVCLIDHKGLTLDGICEYPQKDVDEPLYIQDLYVHAL